mmetsp:Transcript_18607/g.35811  ORF Transcript_18607/g.35811 Transcript_18607/m.35811 type:complete len:504 (-) Transcript_18607:141-1652(-)
MFLPISGTDLDSKRLLSKFGARPQGAASKNSPALWQMFLLPRILTRGAHQWPRPKQLLKPVSKNNLKGHSPGQCPPLQKQPMPPLPQQQQHQQHCVLEDGGASPNSPFGDSFGPRPSTPAARASVARPASALGTTARSTVESQQEPVQSGAAEFHHMAEGDSSGLSRCPSEESIDWCCGLDADAPVADLRAFHGYDVRQQEACNTSGRVPRSRSVPAGSCTAVACDGDLQGCRGAMVLTEAPESTTQSRELVAQQLMLRQCLDSQDSLRNECSQIRQSQLAVANSLQETNRMVTALHGALAEERAARQAERRERAALREDLRTVSSQMSLMAQGQLEMQRALAAFCARAAEPATAAPAPAEAAAAATAPPAPLLPAEPHPVSISGETRPNASASSDRAPVQPSLADTRLREAMYERRKSCEERFAKANSRHGAEGSRRLSHRNLQHRKTVQLVQPSQQPGIQRQLHRNSHGAKPVGQRVRASSHQSHSESTQALEESSADAFL